MPLHSPLKPFSRLSYFIDGVNLMDEGGVQFYLDHVVVVHDSGAMLGGREGVQKRVERKEGCEEQVERRGGCGGRRKEGRKKGGEEKWI